MNYSKVLIINIQSLYEKNATGITLRNMFKTWPEDRVLEVFFLETRESVSEENINIPSLIMPQISRPLDYFFRKTIAFWLSPQINRGILNDERIGNIQKAEQKETLKEFVRGVLDVSPLIVNDKNLLEKVDNFKPEVIYTMGASISTLKLALYFSKRYSCKIVLHSMDNWRDTLYASNILMKPFKKTLDRYLKSVEKRMKNGLAISEKMAHEYSKRSGCEYKAIMNCVKEPLTEAATLTSNKEVIFTYAGGLHLNRWESLIMVEKCISKLRDKGIPASLYIYTTDKDRESYETLFDSKVTRFKGFLQYDNVNEAYLTSDILIHIESFSQNKINYTKYSLSTKIPEYMASGKPILCFAPSNIAVYEYINNTCAGIAVSTQQELLHYAEKLVQLPELRLKYGNNGLKTVRQRHTQKATDTLLQEVLGQEDNNI